MDRVLVPTITIVSVCAVLFLLLFPSSEGIGDAQEE